jgi:hypothetical protein
MQFNALVDVAIGLTLLYLLLSLFVTVINEWIGSIFKLRARNLRRGLKALIDDRNLHSLFAGTATYRSIQKASGEVRWGPIAAVGPSYLPSDRFAAALVEALAKKGGIKLADLDPAKLREIVDSLPNCLIKDQIIALFAEAGHSIDSVKDTLAHWFDDMMDRASGVFRRWMQLVSFVIALALSIALNVDTVFIGSKLWQDDALRAQLTQAAQEFAAKEKTLDAAAAASLSEIQSGLRPFPIGWDDKIGSKNTIVHILGIFLTAVAISLGAPFWFGILEKLTKMRGAGNVPAKSDELDSDMDQDGNKPAKG